MEDLSDRRQLFAGYDEGALPYGQPNRVSTAVTLIFVVAAMALAVVAGLQLRLTLWDRTTDLRTPDDAIRSFATGLDIVRLAKMREGDEAADSGPAAWRDLLGAYLAYYTHVAGQSTHDDQKIDYPPLRLAIVAAWANVARMQHPDVTTYSEEVAGPMIRLNLAFEIAAMAAAFLLVAYWIRRNQLSQFVRPRVPGLPQPSAIPRAAIGGLIAAVLVWFNPAILLEAHAWPQWDVWLVPLYLAAMLYASAEWFFAAGVCVAIGALLNAHMLLVAPIFVLWPIFAGRFGPALRVLGGFALTFSLACGYWLVSGETARIWIAAVVACAACFAPWGYPKRLGISWWIAAAVATGLVIWPWLNVNQVNSIWMGLGLVAMILVAPWWIDKRTVPAWIALVLAAAVVASAVTFGAEWDWVKVGFLNGPKRFVQMATGPASNLPALMAQTYGWKLDQILFTIDSERTGVHWDVTVQAFAIALYCVTLVLCSIGAAIHDRRHNPHLLISLIAPWVLMFTILPQMHERYLIWAAAISAAAVAVSVGWTLLSLLLMVLSTLMIAQYLLQSHNNFAPEALRRISPTHPAIAWMLLLLAGIYLYGAFFPRERKKPVTTK
ncbi:MAG TPA: hypothetical protein VL282_14745 [Tepidisphaeraceae bacterium]|nr:hypothetical protein [Tepidisphaeraceae bacterium]